MADVAIQNQAGQQPRPLQDKAVDLSDGKEIEIPFPNGYHDKDVAVTSQDGQRIFGRAPAGFALMLLFLSRFGHPIFPVLATKLREQLLRKNIKRAVVTLRAISIALVPSEREAVDTDHLDDAAFEAHVQQEVELCKEMLAWYCGQNPLRDTFVEPKLYLDGIEFSVFAAEVGRRAFPEEDPENGPQGEEPPPSTPPPWWDEVIDAVIPILQKMKTEMTDGLVKVKEKEKKVGAEDEKEEEENKQ
jgi:hypothetical protein